MASKYTDRIIYSFNGFATQEAAQKELDDMLVWFQNSFNTDDYTVTSGIAKTPYGWRTSFEAEKTN